MRVGLFDLLRFSFFIELYFEMGIPPPPDEALSGIGFPQNLFCGKEEQPPIRAIVVPKEQMSRKARCDDVPYVKETVKCGAVIEVRKYYSARYKCRDMETREEKALPTSEAQRKINLKNSETKLRRILNANFVPGDLHISLTYDPRYNPPACFEEAKKNMQLFFRRLKRRCKKEGIEFKAVYVNGVGARSFHHHLVISKEAGEFIKECWSFGRPFFVMLEDNGDYSALASYLAKHFEKLIKHGEGKKWHEVGDIIRPIVKKEIVKANKFSEIPKVKTGYYLDENSIEMGINDFSGYPYLSYRLIRLPEKKPRAFLVNSE